jgi:cysteine desulfurase
MSQAVYLDYHASTPCDPQVVEAMMPFLVDCCANPGSTIHREGLRAANAVEVARTSVSDAIGASKNEVVFTSGATESNNLAMLGLARASRTGRRRIIVSAIEHKCVLNTARHLMGDGWQVELAPVLSDGTVDLAALVDLVDERTALVSIQAANNEIGTIQPVGEIGQIVHRAGAVFHCDAAQALGRLDIDVGFWDVDLLSLSAHKAYGPKGVGALFVRGGAAQAPLEPLVFGGGQEQGLRSGTLNVPGIVGFGRAAELAVGNRVAENGRIEKIRDYMEGRILGGIPEVRRNGALQQRLSGNSSLTIPGCEAEAIIARMPEFAFSAGSACASGAIDPSHVLTAIGVGRAEAHQTIRVGLGRFSSPSDAERFVDALVAGVQQVRLATRGGAVRRSA